MIELEESWQAAARETREETGIAAEAAEIEVFDVHSAPDGTVLIFGQAPEKAREVMQDTRLSPEASELVVVEEPRALAFPLHTEMLGDWFAE